MTTRLNVGQLRRELRFSKAAMAENLLPSNLRLDQVKPLTEALLTSSGLLGLYGSELLVLEKMLGFHQGKPAVQLVGELISVKSATAGTKVSYGYLGELTENGNLGLVGLGFSDGLPRNSTNHFSVEIANNNYPGLGRIAMDQLVLNLGDASPAIGSEVFFFTEAYSLADFAKASGLSQLELLGRVTDRVSRMWSE